MLRKILFLRIFIELLLSFINVDVQSIGREKINLYVQGVSKINLKKQGYVPQKCTCSVQHHEGGHEYQFLGCRWNVSQRAMQSNNKRHLGPSGWHVATETGSRSLYK